MADEKPIENTNPANKFLEELQNRANAAEETLIAFESGLVKESELICPIEYIKKERDIANEYIHNFKVMIQFAKIRKANEKEVNKEE